MKPQLRQLRKHFQLPISRLAYTRIYEKAKDVMEKLASSGIPGIGTIETLFGMLADTYSGAHKPEPADDHVLYGVYLCLLADVEAARLRSVAARERAAKRAAEKPAEEKPAEEKPAEEAPAEEKPKPRKPAPEPQPVRYRYGIPVKPPTSISAQNWVNKG